jgi:hypothetical protein
VGKTNHRHREWSPDEDHEFVVRDRPSNFDRRDRNRRRDSKFGIDDAPPEPRYARD